VAVATAPPAHGTAPATSAARNAPANGTSSTSGGSANGGSATGGSGTGGSGSGTNGASVAGVTGGGGDGGDGGAGASAAAVREHSEWVSHTFVPSLLSRPLTAADASVMVKVATGAARPDTSEEGTRGDGGTHGSTSRAKLPKTMANDLTARQERALECLRYFYGCFPLSQPGARERATRLHLALEEQRNDLARVKASLPRDQPEMSSLAMERLNPLLDMIGAAAHRFDAHRQLGASQS